MKRALRILEMTLDDIEATVPMIFGRRAIQPARLLARVDRAMEWSLRAVGGVLMAPNIYRIVANPTAVEELEEMWSEVAQDIDRFLEMQAEDQGYIFGWPRRYLIDTDERVRPWSVRVESWCDHPDTLTQESYDGQGRLRRTTTAVPRVTLPEHPSGAGMGRSRARAAAQEARATLHLMDGPQAGEQFTLPRGNARVGRDESCDLVVRDLRVSRLHAILLFNSDGYYLAATEARNGTYLNGAPLSPAPVRLTDGARISLGGFEMIFEEDW